MPRIRTLKPEIWTSRDFMSLSECGQLAFVALITLADDEGRLEADADYLHLVALHRSDPAAIEGELTTMQRRKMIQRYEADGLPLVQLLNWPVHQKVDHPRPSKLPAPPTTNHHASSRKRAKPREVSRDEGNESRDDPEDSRGNHEASGSPRAPADRIGSDLKREPSPPSPPRGPMALQPAWDEDPDGFRPERLLSAAVGARARLIHQGCVEILQRPLHGDEFQLPLLWAELKRNAQYVPVEEILAAVRHKMAQPDDSGALVGSLKWAASTVDALRRAPFNPNGQPAVRPVRRRRLTPMEERNAAIEARHHELNTPLNPDDPAPPFQVLPGGDQ